MIVVETVENLRALLNEKRSEGNKIGFVPTMGYLHEGHLSLIDKARNQTDVVVLSIFVNPLQFGPNEDFDRYPRNFDQDKILAENAGVDILFYPSVKEMYPAKMAMKVIVTEGADVLCGKSRPSHFDGVATVVLKLFQMVSPHTVYFGMKDAQQVAIIEKLIRDFNLSIDLVRCPTLREEDGLAKSSRNVNLSKEEREEAPAIYKSLQQAVSFIDEGEKNPTKIKNTVVDYLKQHTTGHIDYVEILSYPDLQPINQIELEVIIAIALQYTKARLIDNVVINL